MHHQPSRRNQIDDFRPFLQNSFKTPKALRMGVLKDFFLDIGVDSTPMSGRSCFTKFKIWSHREGEWQASLAKVQGSVGEMKNLKHDLLTRLQANRPHQLRSKVDGFVPQICHVNLRIACRLKHDLLTRLQANRPDQFRSKVDGPISLQGCTVDPDQFRSKVVSRTQNVNLRIARQPTELEARPFDSLPGEPP